MADEIAKEPVGPSDRRVLKVLMLAVAWLAMIVFACHACTRMVAAGDTWVAMACGRHFVNHGVNTVEPFSANSHKPGPTAEEVKTWPDWARWVTDKVGLKTIKAIHPTGWVNQNWLTHVIFYWLTTTLGSEQEPYYDALVVWKVAIYLSAVAGIYALGRILGAHPLLAAASACFAVFVGRSFLDIRPAGFSNLLVPVFILILALATYRNILYLWLIVPVTVFWANVHGGYLYVFIMLVPFIGMHLISIPFKRSLVSIGWKGLAHAAAVYVVAFVAMVIFNPFHLTNLTHTFVISLSKNAERWRDVHEWHRAFDWSNPVGTAVPFLVMFAIACLTLVTWIVVRVAGRPSEEPVRGKAARKKTDQDSYQWPRIDLAMWAIAAMTIYMALRSRRFIPIAAFAACPVVASMIQQTVGSILAATGLRRWGRISQQTVNVAAWQAVVLGLGGALVVGSLWYLAFGGWLYLPIPDRPEMLQPRVELLIPGVILAFLAVPLAALFYFRPRTAGDLRPEAEAERPQTAAAPATWLAGALLTLFVFGFGGWAAYKFKYVYMDPWPPDGMRTSVFMRMTASFLKPFEACQFIRDNHMTGNMMNYWTEGGFIAWGEQPDPNTGKTPLQLFMDGRAQAAYDTRAFDEWSYIWAGGDPVQQAVARGKALTAADYTQVGQWISQRLRLRHVWVSLVPAQQFDSAFTRGLEASADWPVVYVDTDQRIYADIRTEQGRRLFEGIATGQTVWPDEFTKELNLAFHELIYDPTPGVKATALQHAIAAYRAYASPVAMLAIVNYGDRYPDLRPQIKAFCDQQAQDFQAHGDQYRNQDGYRARLESQRMVAEYLARVANQLKNPQAVQAYVDKAAEYRAEREELTDLKRW